MTPFCTFIPLVEMFSTRQSTYASYCMYNGTFVGVYCFAFVSDAILVEMTCFRFAFSLSYYLFGVELLSRHSVYVLYAIALHLNRKNVDEFAALLSEIQLRSLCSTGRKVDFTRILLRHPFNVNTRTFFRR